MLRLKQVSASGATSSSIGAWLSLVERCVRDAEVAGSNPVAPTYREPLCIKGSFLVCLNFTTLKFARCQDYVKIFGGIL